ncbi:MAG TPA: glycosyltransferase family 4 protein [Streptomyces sp.]|jgi:glycosyltransferase involved in cell wall biosynthesis|nr:glycosyltransferase family 4 protein [Streptomyces sp.]
MPGDVDDAGSPSGGNAYDRRMCRELAARGRPVREVRLSGDWPLPSAEARDELARVLGELPEGSHVLLDGLLACGLPAVVVPQARRLRLAVLVHLPLADETGLAPDVAAELESLEGETLRAAHAVITTSSWAARDVAVRHGLDEALVHTVIPGTDTAPLAGGTSGATGTGGDAPRLLCVAAVTPRKGQDLLAEALAQVQDLPWTCEFVGSLDRDPGYTRQLREAIDRSGLSGRVQLAGPRTGERLEAAYDAADLFVLASHAETYGMVLTEALARGIPVLATTAGAVPDTVGKASDGSIPGILVPPGDTEALAAALRRWLTDPSIHRHLTTSARDRRAGLQGWPEASGLLNHVLEHLHPEPPEPLARRTAHG